MKTKNIFKALALAMLMPAMVLTTACSNDDDVVNNENTENTIKKGSTLPVTINVTRQGDNATTRAVYNESTKKLEFSAGDQLFVQGLVGTEPPFKKFAGLLEWQSGGTFSGTVYYEDAGYTGTADDLLKGADWVDAYLMPDGYDKKGYLTIGYRDDENKQEYDRYLDWGGNPFAETKAEAVEQFSLEHADSYFDGFALSPENAILNFTINGLTPSTSVDVTLEEQYCLDITGAVTTDGSGTATFAMAKNSEDLSKCTLTVGGNVIALPVKETEPGHIYNITRSAAPAGNTIDLSTVTVATTAQDGDVLTGTLANNVKISIADGATVTLDNASINADGTWTSGSYAGLTCLGDATIILKDGTTNTVRGFNSYYPGLQPGPDGKTLTIKGTGSLNAICAKANYPAGAGIGAARTVACGNIVIEGGDITATGGYAGIGGAYGSSGYEGTCGDITITGGTVTATALSYGAGIGGGRGEYGGCGKINISGGTVTAIATAKNSVAAAIGTGSLGSTCTSVTITTGITSLTMTNSHSSATGIVSNFLNATNATDVYANTTPITAMLSLSVTDATVTAGMTMAGFTSSYDSDAKTWTVSKP